MNVKVKICGIRSIDTAQGAIEAGADFLGFNFVSSSHRYIDPTLCQSIINHTRRKAQMVGVFQNEKIDTVNTIADLLKLDLIQLHGEEDNEYIKNIKRPVIKSISVANLKKNITSHFLLLDRVEQGKGDMADLQKAKKLAEEYHLFFAGGLTSENVAVVIKKVRPFAVDVAGGVETEGKEDMQKIKQFIRNAKGVNI